MLNENCSPPGDLKRQINALVEHFKGGGNAEGATQSRVISAITSLSKVTLADAYFRRAQLFILHLKGSDDTPFNICACNTANSPHNAYQPDKSGA
jgi:hypothetical protein